MHGDSHQVSSARTNKRKRMFLTKSDRFHGTQRPMPRRQVSIRRNNEQHETSVSHSSTTGDGIVAIRFLTLSPSATSLLHFNVSFLHFVARLLLLRQRVSATRGVFVVGVMLSSPSSTLCSPISLLLSDYNVRGVRNSLPASRNRYEIF